MQNAKRSRGLILFYAAFVALSSLFLLARLFLPLAASENSILFGLSLARLTLILGFLTVSLIFAALFCSSAAPRRFPAMWKWIFKPEAGGRIGTTGIPRSRRSYCT